MVVLQNNYQKEACGRGDTLLLSHLCRPTLAYMQYPCQPLLILFNYMIINGNSDLIGLLSVRDLA
jgi:hypothetical protein